MRKAGSSSKPVGSAAIRTIFVGRAESRSNIASAQVTVPEPVELTSAREKIEPTPASAQLAKARASSTPAAAIFRYLTGSRRRTRLRRPAESENAPCLALSVIEGVALVERAVLLTDFGLWSKSAAI